MLLISGAAITLTGSLGLLRFRGFINAYMRPLLERRLAQPALRSRRLSTFLA